MSPFPISKRKKVTVLRREGRKGIGHSLKKGGRGDDEVGRKTALSTFKTPSRSFFLPPTVKRGGGGALGGDGGGRMKEGGDGRLAHPPSLTHAHTRKRGGEGTQFEKWSRNEKEGLDLGRALPFFFKRKESSRDNALRFLFLENSMGKKMLFGILVYVFLKHISSISLSSYCSNVSTRACYKKFGLWALLYVCAGERGNMEVPTF